MTNKKANVLMVLGLFVLIGLIGGLSIAFFNYTRTGSPNLLTTGDISFNSNYETVTIANIFPIATANVGTDTNNVMTVNVNVTGSTTYANGLYYEVTADNVNLTVNGKNIPVSIQTTASNLNNVTLTSYENGKVLTDGSLFAYGTIPASDATHDNSVDGTITLKVYLDASKIAVTDTIENGAIYATGYDNGTNTRWINGRTVLTTQEWNNLANTPLSFKVKVEAYENDVARLVGGGTFNKKIKKISGSIDAETEALVNQQYTQYQMLFSSDSEMTEQMIAMYGISDINEIIDMVVYGNISDTNITTFQRVTTAPDTSSFTEDNIISTNDSAYPIYAWYDNGVIKYYSESQNIKTNSSMGGMFSGLVNLTNIGDLGSLDTTNVKLLLGIFSGCGSLNNISALTNWNVANVVSMQAMFSDCSSLTNVNALANWNTINVTSMSILFSGCGNLIDISGLSNWNTSNVMEMQNMFLDCSSLTNLNSLSNWDTSKVTNMSDMFYQCTSLTNLSGLSNWNTSSVTTMSNMFNGCTGLTNLSGLANWNTSNVLGMATMFSRCSGIVDASAINDWDISSVTIFGKMFYGAPSHPTFTKRAGTWNSQGTFTPSS